MSSKDLKFNEITKQNWNEPDETTLSIFDSLSIDGKVGLSQEEIIDMILEPQLEEEVPLDVRELFEVARAVFIYGYYFYPFYTLGAEQMTRVLESAVYKKCEEIEAPPGVMDNFRMQRGVDYLASEGIINDKEITWDASRCLRNLSSHLESQNLLSPFPAIGDIKKTAEMINSLY